MSALRWEVYEDEAGEHRWRAIARNGKIVADGAEGYASKRNASRALSSFRAAVREPDAPAEQPSSSAERCTCKTPTLSKAVSNLCTACGHMR